MFLSFRLFTPRAALSEGIIYGRSRFRIGHRPAPKNQSTASTTSTLPI
ncbi:MAG: hypothetical protein J6U48_06135 [Alistipes sp.]|nr:hypothetical protein [Alistipes sp.]